MSLSLKGIPQYVRLVGWWEGAGHNDRHFGSFIPRIGTNASRPPGARFYFVQAFARSSEGYELPVGLASFPLQKLATGAKASTEIRSPYGGREGTA